MQKGGLCLPQQSIYYALGRISVLSSDAMNKQKLDRLLQSQNAQELKRALQEIGWADIEDVEKAVSEHVVKACKVIRDLSVNEETLDCFLLRYDVNNLKMLLKARTLSMTAEHLSPCGTISVETLKHAVTEHQYRALPEPLKKAMENLEKELAVHVDPLNIDVTLDKALYETIFSMLKKQDKVAHQYFVAQVDMTNFLMAARCLNIKKPTNFFTNLLIEQGTVPEKQWIKAYENPERLPDTVKKYGIKVHNAAIQACVSKEKLPSFEREMEDYLLGLYMPFKRVMDKNERLLGYLLMRQREAAAIKLITAGKKSGFAQNVITERLRELYGR